MDIHDDHRRVCQRSGCFRGGRALFGLSFLISLSLSLSFSLAPPHASPKHLYKDHTEEAAVHVRDFAYQPNTSSHFGRFALRADRPMRKVKAIYDFQAQDENELYLNVDDIVDVIYERSDGWLVGVLNGISGLVPANHVEPYVEAAPTATTTGTAVST